MNKFKDLFKIEIKKPVNKDLLEKYYNDLELLINISEKLFKLVDYAYKNPKIHDNRFLNFDNGLKY